MLQTIFNFIRYRGVAGVRASSVAAQGSRVQGVVNWAVCGYFKWRKYEFCSQKF